MSRLEAESKRQYVRSGYLAMGHAALGNFDEAFESLERAYQGAIYWHDLPAS